VGDPRGLVGEQFGPTEWVEVEQGRIDAFAAATGDQQWIHVDPGRATDGPFGSTIAHGYLTLSLLPSFAYQALPPLGEARLTINYGLNRVRFPAPVPVGSRLRGRFRVLEVAEVDGGFQLTVEATVEREGGDKPVCVAETVYRVVG
jgi:acyl dehydratase